MRIGIIGSGWVTGIHLDHLKKIEEAEVVAIAGIEYDRVQELAAQVKANPYENYLDMLKKEKLDAAFIFLPPHVHGERERACAEHVKAVLVEKPIANSIETALEIDEIFKNAGTIAAAGYMHRYRQSISKARELFSQPNNTVVTANGWWVVEMPPPMWWRTMEQSGGQFVEQTTHLVDSCRYIMGDIVEVSAYAARDFMSDVEKFTVDDASVVNVRFASGAVGNFTSGCFPKAGYDASSGIGLTLSSRNNKVTFRGWILEGTIYSGPCNDLSVEKVPAEADFSIFEVQDRALIQAVTSNDLSLIKSPYSDAVKSLKVTLAANESMRNGAPVAVR